MLERTAPFVLTAVALAGMAITSACSRGPGEGPGPGEPVSITISPTSGGAGTEVAIEASGFPSDAPVDIGIGPPQSEYEVLERTRTDEEGRVSTTLSVPSWTEPGRPYVFVVAAWSAEPGEARAVSDPFVVASTGQEAGMRITGHLTDEGVECPALRSDEGTLYTLAGETAPYEVGDRVVVVGAIVEFSVCMQGTTVRVDTIRAGPDSLASGGGLPLP